MPQLTGWEVESGLPKRERQREVRPMQTDDIPGAQARPAHRAMERNYAEIAGTKSARLVPERVTRPADMSLRNDDIPFTKSAATSFNTTRSCDPLMPEYKVASCAVRPPTPPRQLFETNKVSDIPGTSPSPIYKWAPRDTMNVSDIEKAVSVSTIGRRTPGYGLRTDDICKAHGQRGFVTARVTDPLSPRYKIANPHPDGPYELGMDGQNHPKKPPRARKPEESDFTLRSADIPGSQPRGPLPASCKREQWRKTCDLSDIPHASPSLRHSAMRPSGRVTDPNNPRYTPLDHKETRVQLDLE